MKYLYNTIYYILIFILSMLVNLVWLSYFLKNLWLIISISAIITILVILIITKKNHKKNLKDECSKKDKEEIEKLKYYLMFSNKKNSTNLLKAVLKNNLETNRSNTILIDKNSASVHIPMFYKSEITTDDISSICHEYRDKYSKIYIYCIDKNIDVEKVLDVYLLSEYIEVVTVNALYMSYIKQNIDIMQSINIPSKQKKNYHIREVLHQITSPNNWNKYAIYGIIMLTFNMFNKSKIYFSIFATAFLILSIICIYKKLFYHPKDNL